MHPSLKFQYLGQAGLRITDSTTTIVIDPYLSYSVDRLEGFPPGFWTRNYPPPIDPRRLADVNLVLCSHDHLDHTDPATLGPIAQASPHCRFAGPIPAIARMHATGIHLSRCIALNAGQCLAINEVLIETIAAAHESYEIDAAGNHQFLGFLIRWNGHTIYHAGDTVVTAELSARLEQERIDVGFLPVNGGDEDRRRLGIIGNMDVVAAAELAERRRFGLFIPLHYDLYASNGFSTDEFMRLWTRQPAAKEIALKVLRPGQGFEWPALNCE